jgi:dihydroorotate dehydrogenase electron transfer subunit
MMLIEKRLLRPDCAEFWLEASPAVLAACAPGRFLHIDCGPEFSLRRPIGICRIREGALSVVFALRGAGTSRLAETPVGGTVDCVGPLGKGFDLARKKKRLLIGGGTGTPPILFAAEVLAKSGQAADVLLAFGSASQVILVDEMTALCHEATISTDDGSLGVHARADHAAAALLDGAAYDEIVVCGPTPMMKAIAALAKARGVACQVSLEERMACGIGACLVCACKLADGAVAHVCTDGPAFDAAHVAWEGW